MTTEEVTIAERFFAEAEKRAIGRLYHAVIDKIGHNELAKRLGIDPGYLSRLKDRYKPQEATLPPTKQIDPKDQ